MQIDELRQLELEKWFTASYEAIEAHIYECVAVTRTENILTRLCSELPKCKAKSPAQFRKWAFRVIDRLADQSRVVGHTILPPVSSLPRKGIKPFAYEVHGDKAFIRLQDAYNHVWIIPSHWLTAAKRLWPVHLRKFPDGTLYLAKKFRQLKADGSVGQTVIPVHRLFLDAQPGEFVVTTSGNYLDFTDVHIRKPRTSRDIWDLAVQVPFDDVSNTIPTVDVMTLGSMPAKPTRPPGPGPDMDEPRRLDEFVPQQRHE
jgi:hypothetical protein